MNRDGRTPKDVSHLSRIRALQIIIRFCYRDYDLQRQINSVNECCVLHAFQILVLTLYQQYMFHLRNHLFAFSTIYKV